MARRKQEDTPAERRFTPGTVVIWFEGTARKVGRVQTNLPGAGGRWGTVVIKGVDGRRVAVRADKVHLGGSVTPC